MRKALILALVLSTTAAVPVCAQGITYNTGFMVQNLGTGPANLTITFYDQAGNAVAVLSGAEHVIPAGGSKSYYPLPAQVPNGFNGSVTIASDQPVNAIANELGNGLDFGASYTSLGAGASEVFLPLIMRNNGGFNTWFNVQNAGAADAHVTVTYTPAQAGNSGVTQSAVIRPGAAHTFDQATLTALGSRFVGSAMVSSNQPVVATCNQVGPTTLLAYNGFTAGSLHPAFPLVNHNNAGYLTGIQIMNIGNVDTTVTISYTPCTAGTDSTETKRIPAKGSAQFVFRHFSQRFVGSGIVTVNSANQPLVSVVNQLNSGANKAASYAGFDPNTATDKISFPLVMSRNSGYYSAISLMNVSASPCTVTITYSDGSSESVPLIPSECWVASQMTSFPGRFVGSATVSSSGCKIIGIVNQLNPTLSGDAFLVYEGFNF
jgi:hypothetical protein